MTYHNGKITQIDVDRLTAHIRIDPWQRIFFLFNKEQLKDVLKAFCDDTSVAIELDDVTKYLQSFKNN